MLRKQAWAREAKEHRSVEKDVPCLCFVPQIWLAILFGIATVVTTINSNGAPLLQWMISPFYTLLTPEMLQEAAPATLLLWFILGAWAPVPVGWSSHCQ